MNGTMSATQPARLRDNGRSFAREVEPRSHLADFLRHDLGLTGTHIGCEQGAAPARCCSMTRPCARVSPEAILAAIRKHSGQA